MQRNFSILLLAAFTVLTAACIHFSDTHEISRGRAIEIARGQVSFPLDRIEAVKSTSGGRDVWRVTFHGRLPGQPSLLFETMVVEIDRHSGEVVSVARS